MFTIKNIKDISNAEIINGKVNEERLKFSISNKNHYKDEFYIPIFLREDRQKYILDSVKARSYWIYD